MCYCKELFLVLELDGLKYGVNNDLEVLLN